MEGAIEDVDSFLKITKTRLKYLFKIPPGEMNSPKSPISWLGKWFSEFIDPVFIETDAENHEHLEPKVLTNITKSYPSPKPTSSTKRPLWKPISLDINRFLSFYQLQAFQPTIKPLFRRLPYEKTPQDIYVLLSIGQNLTYWEFKSFCAQNQVDREMGTESREFWYFFWSFLSTIFIIEVSKGN